MMQTNRKWLRTIAAALVFMLGTQLYGLPSILAQDAPFDPLQLESSPLPGEAEPLPAEDTSPATSVPMPPVLPADVDAQASAAYQRGWALLQDGQFAEAVVQFNQALEHDASLRQAYIDRAKALSKLGRYDQAVRSLANALTGTETRSQTDEVYFQRGQVYFEAGDFHRSLEDYNRALEIDPTKAEYSYHRGLALLKLAAEDYAAGVDTAATRLRAAVGAFDRAIAARDDYAPAYAQRGVARLDLGNVDKAIADLQRAVELEPDNAPHQHRLAVAHLQRAAQSTSRTPLEQRDDVRSAIAALDEVLSNPDNNQSSESDELDLDEVRLTRAVARVQLASLLPADDRKAHYREAVADCEEVIAARPELHPAHFHHGVALRLLGRYRDAIESLTESLRLAPENTEARLRRGITWYYLGEFDLAMSDFRRIGLVPGDPRPAFWMGVIHGRRGDHIEAIGAYTESLKQNRRYRLALVNRSLSYMHLQKWQRAIGDLNELIQLDPDDALAYYRRGLAQLQLDRRDEARRSIARAIRFAPDEPRYRQTARELGLGG